MLLLEREQGQRRTGGTLGRKRTMIVRPSRVSGNPREQKQYLDEIPYGGFGRFNLDAIRQPNPESTADIVRFLALHPGSRPEAEALCVRENPGWFSAWSTVKLFDSSLRLPADEIVMHTVVDPMSIPGDPPQCVVRRWVEAYCRHPDAIGLYFEPIFDFPDEAEAHALTADELRTVVTGQWDQLHARAARWGWVLRTGQRALDWIDAYERARAEKADALKRQLAEQAERNRLAQLEFQRRLAERRVVRAPRAASAANVALAAFHGQFDANVLAEAENLERDVRVFGAQLRARGSMDVGTARRELSRREFTVAMLLGLVVSPSTGRYRRYDPVLCLKLAGEGNTVRLVAHWDKYFVVENGVRVKKNVIHV